MTGVKLVLQPPLNLEGKIKMIKDLAGQKFGRLFVDSFAYKGKHSRSVWNCICECGNKIQVYSQRLILGNTRSCGCLQKEIIGNIRRKEYGVAALTSLYSHYKQSAKRRDYIFELTKDEFKELTSQNCFYCNAEPAQCHSKAKQNGPYIYNGIDRINNNLGYIKGNVVPCCKTCNRAKDVMTQEEFLEWIRRVYERNHKTSRS